MKQTANERGIMPILVTILVVVILAAVGVAAYNISKSHQNNTHTTASVSPSATASPSATQTPTSGPGVYLDIKELGVKIRLNDDIKDATYKIVGGTSAKISTQSLINSSADCTPGAVGPLGTVGKTANPNQGFGTLSPNNETVFKFGSYYYYYQTPQSPCGAPQAMQSEQLQSFEQAFKTIQPD